MLFKKYISEKKMDSHILRDVESLDFLPVIC